MNKLYEKFLDSLEEFNKFYHENEKSPFSEEGFIGIMNYYFPNIDVSEYNYFEGLTFDFLFLKKNKIESFLEELVMAILEAEEVDWWNYGIKDYKRKIIFTNKRDLENFNKLFGKFGWKMTLKL